MCHRRLIYNIIKTLVRNPLPTFIRCSMGNFPQINSPEKFKTVLVDRLLISLKLFPLCSVTWGVNCVQDTKDHIHYIRLKGIDILPLPMHVPSE